ncbi:MAG: RNA-binding transcriptional accessory protein, partial [Clostridiales bacterium]|nr:RNA-binding transcriptional accessory protein [Clostridiales bacterium]
MNINQTLAQEFKLQQQQIDSTIELIDDGKTIPFIARYRKEVTGSLDDQVLREIFDRLTYLRNLDKRKDDVSNSITEQGKMTDEIALEISKAATLVEVEDIYRPFKQKRKTRASVARAKGLEPLAEIILLQDENTNPLLEAEAFLVETEEADKSVADVNVAIQG